MTSETLAISGMHCSGCVRSVTNALKRVLGVKSIEVSLPENSAKVEYDEKETDQSELRKAIQEIGYDVKE